MNLHFNNLKRWLLPIYSIFSAIITVIYIMFNSTFYKLDLVRYSNDIDYYNKMSAILPKGLLQLNGDFSQLDSPLLIIVYLLGILICLISLKLNWNPYYERTYTPLISMFGFLLPLLIRNGENIIWMLLLGLIMAFIGSFFYVFAVGKAYK
ncbi:MULTISPECIES: hypothetical protein [Lactococcus]|uniref:Transporter n=1 Tax=Lactococcus lactis subsp. lactis bv. diacetylactis TaxID=44688 RepID=A0A8B3EV46_LACLL|nr:hypothetical protein [Lactococcus lactis]KST41657.1 transporter [Lactococcus lactis subsp. lactis bv. diacetylactis]MCT3141985.1 transporter [Lactococcus lactis]QNT21651.1 transporter [Lactococcus lactis subsp. lactis bv. diacetylactis]